MSQREQAIYHSNMSDMKSGLEIHYGAGQPIGLCNGRCIPCTGRCGRR